RRRRFCVYIADHLVPRAAFAMAELMHGLLVDECVYSLALSDIDSYRWLRRLCISRLVGGLVPAGPDAADQRMFDASFEALCRFSGQVDLRQGTGERALEDIAQACADLIAESGIAAVTHRAVGQRAAVAASTVAYHFATQPDLVRAGLTRLIPPEQARLEIDGSASFVAGDVAGRVMRPFQGFEIARVGFGVALAAVRDPEWCATAAALRARRGYFLRNTLIDMLAPAPFDALGVQAVIMGSSGYANLHAVRGAEAASKLALPLIFDTLRIIR
ncbi:MAG: TetR family transcriptional regulator, partial [Asticcacaulis sp.]|nr:TetR family transcriptional regulator [Asticcacaulis sp.]